MHTPPPPLQELMTDLEPADSEAVTGCLTLAPHFFILELCFLLY